MSTTVLTIEDDTAIRRGIVDTLRFSGYEVIECGDGKSGLDAALTRQYDLLLLDLVLPAVSGLEILEQVRKVHPIRPIIILSAKGEENDRVRGLRGGADDYMVKPFGVQELIARIEAVLRRTPARPIDIERLCLPNGHVDLIRGEVHTQDSVVGLSAKEIEVLRYLAINPSRVISRDDLLTNVWHIDPRNSNTRVVDMTVSRLREKLGPLTAVGEPMLITMHGRGYTLSSQVHALTRNEAAT